MAKITNNQADVVSGSARAARQPSGGTASPSPEMLEKLGEVRSKLSTAFSQVTMAMITTPRYRNLSIADLEWLVLEPLLRHRIAIAAARKGEDRGADPIVGFAVWAKVSDEVNAKIEEQVRAGTFPVRLRGADWNSGEIVWLLDVVATDRKLAGAVLMNFGQLAKGVPVRVHPMVARVVEPGVLTKLTGKPASGKAKHQGSDAKN